MTNTLRFSTGGLVIARHNEICEKLLYLSRRDFTPASIRAEPLIHQGRTRSEKEIRQVSDKDRETWGGVMVQGLWDCQFDTIINVKIGDSDEDLYKYRPMAALPARWETIKKDKHGKHWHDQQNHFSPFVLSVDGMLGR